MQMSESFVRKLIFKGRMTGIGRLAKAKSVKMLTAGRKSANVVGFGKQGKLTAVEKPDTSKYFNFITSRIDSES